MARTVTFGGITKARPGGISRVRVDNSTGLGNAPTSVALVGEADGGAPGSVSGLISVRDPSAVRSILKSGPLVDAALHAFQSSNDPNVPGGASEVVIFKTNAGTQASVGVQSSKEIRELTTTTSAIADTVVITDERAFAVDEFVGSVVYFQTNAGADIESGVVTSNTATDITFTPSSVSAIVPGTVYLIPAPATTALAAGSTTTVVNTSAAPEAALDPASIVGAKVDYYYIGTDGPAYRRTITAATATSVTLDYALPVAPADGDVIVIYPEAMVVNSSDYGSHTNDISFDYTYTEKTSSSLGGFQVTVELNDEEQISGLLGETPRFDLQYFSTAPSALPALVVAAGGANFTAVSAGNTGGTTLTVDSVVAATTYQGSTVSVSSGGLTEIVRLWDSDGANEIELVSPGLSSAMLTSIADTGATVTVYAVKTAGVRINGASGVATSLSTTVGGVSGADLSISFTPGMTINQLINEINKNPGYTATLRSGVNGDVQLAADLDFGTGYSDIQTDLDRRSVNADGVGYYTDPVFYAFKSRGLTADVEDVVSWINDTAEEAEATRSTLSTLSGGFLPLADYGSETMGIFTGDIVVDDAAGPKLLSGGSRGISSNSSFQAGFDLLLSRPIDYVVPLIDQDLANEGYGSTATWPSVSQQLLAHVTLARGRAGVERGGFIGFRGTKAAYIQACNSLNDMDIQCVSQYPTALDAEGNLVAQGPREFAVMAASMRAGVDEDGLPLTHKYLRISALTQDSSWTPADLTDATDLILNGALFAEYVPGRGFRWVRDLTTFIRTDNITQAEGSVRDLVRKVVYALRTGIEERFTGKKATPTTIAAVRDTAKDILETQRTLERIVDSTDPVTGESLRAYYNLIVFSEGDVVKLSVGIFPVPGINFQLNDVFVSVPTQVAA